MRAHLGERHRFQRQRAEDDQIEASVFEIALEQPVERQQRCQHGGNPQDAAGDPPQQFQIGADAQRHQRRNRREEHDRQQALPPARVASRMSRREEG